MRHGDPMPHESDLDEDRASLQKALAASEDRAQKSRESTHQRIDECAARFPSGKGLPEPQPMADVKHWAELVKARATIARVEALSVEWQASADLRIRAHADCLTEVLNGRWGA